MAKVGIGPNFFANEFRFYQDWIWSFAREFGQNGCDALGTSRIDVTIEDRGDTLLLTVANDGKPMSDGELTDKLLTLGESGKNFSGTVGGMGCAKVILYFAQLGYQIHSGTNVVTGCGGDYEITKTSIFHGTESQVTIKNSTGLADKLVAQFKRWAIMTQRPVVSFTVNGEEIPTNLKKGSRRRAFSWGTVYTNKSFGNRLIVRVDGLPMYTKRIDFAKCVVIELPDSSYLTSNRDGLQYKYQDQFDDFLYELAVNKSRALEEPSVSYIHYQGDKLEARRAEVKQNIAEVLTAAYATVQTAEDVANEEENTGPTLARDMRPMLEENRGNDTHEEIDYGYQPAFGGQKPKRLPRLGFDFIIRDELGMSVPKHYLPESFSPYSAKLLKCWASCLLEIHRLFGNTDDFSVGFVLSETAEALHERGDYGTVLYISPTVVKRNSFGGRSLARRWNFSPAGKMALLSTAVHEFCHRYYPNHSDDWGAFYTECNGAVMKSLASFHKCFRG